MNYATTLNSRVRTIACWVVYYPKERRILNGFRTKKELKAHYPLGIPIFTTLVKMQGNYAAISNTTKT